MSQIRSIHCANCSLMHANRSQCNLMMLRTTCSYLIATEGSYSLPTVQFPTGGGDDCSWYGSLLLAKDCGCLWTGDCCLKLDSHISELLRMRAEYGGGGDGNVLDSCGGMLLALSMSHRT